MPAFPVTCRVTCRVAKPTTPAFKAWVWLLLCAVLLQSGAGALVQVLGRTHTHPGLEAAPPAAWFDAVLAWRASRIETLQTTGVFRHAEVEAAAHHHASLQRHHHGRGDATVQAVDSAGDDADHTNAAKPAPAWGPTAEYRAAPAAQTGAAWPGAPQPAWSSAPTRLPERPPRA